MYQPLSTISHAVSKKYCQTSKKNTDRNWQENITKAQVHQPILIAYWFLCKGMITIVQSAQAIDKHYDLSYIYLSPSFFFIKKGELAVLKMSLILFFCKLHKRIHPTKARLRLFSYDGSARLSRTTSSLLDSKKLVSLDYFSFAKRRENFSLTSTARQAAGQVLYNARVTVVVKKMQSTQQYIMKKICNSKNDKKNQTLFLMFFSYLGIS